MTAPKLEPSRSFDDLRAAHRGDRAPGVFRQRMWERYETSGARARGDVAPGAPQGGDRLRRTLLPSSSLAAFCAVAALGALLIWLIAHPRLDAPEMAVTDAPVSLGDEPSGGQRSKSGRLCPMAELPSGAFVDPSVNDVEPRPNGFAVHTFELQTESCGPLLRRYLELVPVTLPPKTSAPILIALHDQGRNDGWLRIQETRWYFDALARREGFILVYANAAPSSATVPQRDNSGGWQTRAGANPEIDDVAYLEHIVRDLTARGVVRGDNEVLLVGFGEGANMALEAAARRPERYSGVAAFMPTRTDVVLEQGSAARRLSRVLLVTKRSAPRTELRDTARRWALALGATRPGAITSERETFGGLRQIDLSTPHDSSPSVRLLEVDRDLFPPPGAADELALEAARRRPGFVDGAEQVWTFLRGENSRG